MVQQRCFVSYTLVFLLTPYVCVVLSLSNAYVMHLSTNIAGHLSMESMIAVLLAMCSVS